MENLKLLFLDFDGVLNSTQSSYMFWWKEHGKKTFMNDFEDLCPIACSNLNNLLEKNKDLRVVISSTWRIFYEQHIFSEKMRDICPEIVGRIIGMTTKVDMVNRGEEIKLWLKEHNAENLPFIIIDDMEVDEFPGLEDRLIHTDEHLGFTWIDMVRANAILNKSA